MEVETAEGSATDGAVTDANDLGEGVVEPTEGATGEAVDAGTEPELFTVRVNGGEKAVSLDDLISNYSKGEDYTRKTQEIAAQREQVQQMFLLQQALERDPRTTIATLASALGVDLGVNAQQQPVVDDDDPLSVLTAKFDQLSGTLTAQQQAAVQAAQQAEAQRQLQAQIQRETNDLKALHGEFDEQALWQYAFDHGTPNLEVAFSAWQYEQQRAAAIAEKNAAVAAKRKAQVVDGGQSTQAGATTPGGGTGRMSVREAFQLAVAAG